MINMTRRFKIIIDEGLRLDFVRDLEYDLMCYVLKNFGRGILRDNHLWQGKKVSRIYFRFRTLDAGTVRGIIQDGGPDYQYHIDFYN